MEDWEKIHAVNRMQEYIEAHIYEEITLKELSAAAGSFIRERRCIFPVWKC